MRSNLYWVEPERLAIMARPRAGDWLHDEMKSLRERGIHTVVSLLTDDEVRELELEAEKQECETAGLRFHSFPIPDRGLPASLAATRVLAHALAAELSEGRAIAIHCRMGIGRSSIIAAAVLSVLGMPPEDALERLTAARGLNVPDTEEQRQWILGIDLEQKGE
jgi:protein-tyrosine phosphatase